VSQNCQDDKCPCSSQSKITGKKWWWHFNIQKSRGRVFRQATQIANSHENCKTILTFRCIFPTWTFAIFIDTQQLNAEPAAIAGMYYVSYLVLTYISLATSLVCLFSPEWWHFRSNTYRGWLYVTRMNLYNLIFQMVKLLYELYYTHSYIRAAGCTLTIGAAGNTNCTP